MDYPYLPGITTTVNNEQKELADYLCKELNLKKNKFVVDIGSNDGSLLKHFKNNKLKENLLIESLINKIKKNNIDEVIIATSTTIDGQTTSFYIQDCLKDLNVKVSKLAQGIPIGGEIDNLDDGTLHSAFKNRGNLRN